MFEHLLVVELASVLAAPSVGMFFAELGADLIKIENPETGGDVTRSWRISSEDANSDISAYFSAVNWGKKSIAVDLRKEEGRELIRDLAARADILIVSFKPGDSRKFRMDYENIAPLNPGIIYAEITGFGDDDPRTGYDAVIQAETGFMSMNGTPESGPVKMPVALVDILAGHQLKEGILLALMERMKTGKGKKVSVSLFKSGVASLANQATGWLMNGVIPGRIGSEHPSIVPYGASFSTRDGKDIVLAVGSDGQFRRLMEILGEAGIAEREEFATNAARVRNRAELRNILAELIKKFPCEELLEKIHTGNIPAGAVLNMQEVFGRSEAQDMILTGISSGEKNVVGVRSIAFEAGDTVSTGLSAPPHFNQHADEILASYLGYSRETIERLQGTGAILSDTITQ